MEQIISLSQARRRWRRIVRLVEAGRTFVITRHGKPVCTMGQVPKPAPDSMT
ncbi:type II toxin-antitoxin system Phd/YefM family antitoxin [Pseudomonas sp. RC3H12]|uniref:type II toxin-antitoxin system Phd/YefM family antitoxin n=1 Tax=Pseudomonas sp. RC3H12 TaxID=2834406 RepID=UPI001BDF292A|nr:type II toxin-antitoxin system Phd/YefM family antitoxin [Pseudomonas sp. RC3H12]QWA30542.1 type II toxin-antitoxin system Phd/YefM family antitoxin [Pseudomonas sp. RC3H12]